MFGLGKISREPLADVKAAERWLASFPDSDPVAMQREIQVELARLAEPASRRTSSGLEAVFHADAHTAKLRKTLTAQYIEHAARSSRIESQLWQALFDLTQGFLACYAAFAREMSAQAQNSKWRALVPELIAREIRHMGLDAKIRLFRYEQWIPAKWTDLHALFALACSQQIERAPLAVDARGLATTIEHEYVVALVLPLMNSGNLSPKQVEWVCSQLDEWCQPLRLTVEQTSLASFYVDLASRSGLRRRTPSPLGGRVLFIDTAPLHAVLVQNVALLEQKIKTQPLSEKTTRRSEQLALFTKLASQVDPEFKPLERRGERAPAVGTVDAIVGFNRISAYLREEERAPMPTIEPGTSFGGTMEIAIFGHARHEAERRLEQAARRLATYAPPGGPWEIKDVSQTGFRLLAPMSVASAVMLGTLAALRPHGQSTWALGVVRRMKRLTTERAEIGLEVIANALAGVELIEQRKSHDTDYSIDGEATTVNGRTFAALYLSLRKRNDDPAVRTLIVPAAEYHPARRFTVQNGKSISAVRLGRLLEQQPDWVWTAIEPLELSGPRAPEAR